MLPTVVFETMLKVTVPGA